MHASLPFTVLKLPSGTLASITIDIKRRACLLTVYGFETWHWWLTWQSLPRSDVVHASLPFTVLKHSFNLVPSMNPVLLGRACLLTVYGFETLPLPQQTSNQTLPGSCMPPYRLRFWNFIMSRTSISTSNIQVVHASLPFTVLKHSRVNLSDKDVWQPGVVHASLPFTVLKPF